MGYEGAMIRNTLSLYENKRSYGLQKIKEFDDAEFEIIGVEAGRGRMSECAIFVCKTKKGDEFNCKMEGSLDALKVFLQKPKSVIGKVLTVRYQGMTSGDVPRFPIGVTVRNYE
jgi:DNA ligase-1